jgi:nitric oxide synthase oxygenase domain/subunit
MKENGMSGVVPLAARAAAHSHALFIHRTGVLNHVAIASIASLAVPSHHGQRIAFIQASWHKDIVDQCRIAFTEEMAKLGWPVSSIDFFELPGAFEIPCTPRSWPRPASTPASSPAAWWSMAASIATTSWRNRSSRR